MAQLYGTYLFVLILHLILFPILHLCIYYWVNKIHIFSTFTCSPSSMCTPVLSPVSSHHASSIFSYLAYKYNLLNLNFNFPTIVLNYSDKWDIHVYPCRNLSPSCLIAHVAGRLMISRLDLQTCESSARCHCRVLRRQISTISDKNTWMLR